MSSSFSVSRVLINLIFLYSVFNEHFLSLIFIKLLKQLIPFNCFKSLMRSCKFFSCKRCLRNLVSLGSKPSLGWPKFSSHSPQNCLYLTVKHLFTWSISAADPRLLVGPSGLEPPTSCLSGTRSNHLSYEPLYIHIRLPTE